MSNSGIGSVEIKVSTEVLKEQSSNIATELGDMRKNFTKLAELIEGTSGYWVGAAGDFIRKNYKDTEDGREKIVNRLGEHPEDLNDIAGLYEEKERLNEELAAELPGDILV